MKMKPDFLKPTPANFLTANVIMGRAARNTNARYIEKRDKIEDVLLDLMHLAASEGEEFDAALGKARRRYEEDLRHLKALFTSNRYPDDGCIRIAPPHDLSPNDAAYGVVQTGPRSFRVVEFGGGSSTWQIAQKYGGTEQFNKKGARVLTWRFADDTVWRTEDRAAQSCVEYQQAAGLRDRE
jgi:hypothetical protein